MKNMYRYFLNIVVMLLVSHATLNAQWTKTGGPEGGWLTDVERVGNEIWAASPSGIYTSSDEGASWELYNQFVNINCVDIKAFGDTIVVLYFIGDTYDGNVYTRTSFNGGTNWSAQSLVLNGDCDNSRIIRTGDLLLITDLWPENYYSADFGLTWELFSAFDLQLYSTVASNYGVLSYAWNLQPAGEYGYYYFDAATQITTDVAEGIDVWDHTLQDSSIFLFVKQVIDTTYYQRIIRSRNLGLAWDTVYSFPPGPQFAGYFGLINNEIYLQRFSQGQVGPCIKSSDRGDTWINSENPNSYLFSSQNLTLLSDGSFLTAGSFGITKHESNGEQTMLQNTGIAVKQISVLESNNGRLYATTSTASYPNMYISDDAGSTWYPCDSQLIDVRAFVFRGDTIFSANGTYNSFIGRSFNNGASWDTIPLTFDIGSSGSLYSIEELNGKLFIAADNLIFYSTDLGINWQTTTAWPDAVPGVYEDSYDKSGFLKVVNNQLYTVTNDGLIFKYVEASNEWIYLQQFWSTGAYNGNRLFDLNDLVVVSGRQTFQYSNDGGTTWIEPVLNGLPVDSWGDPYYPQFVYTLNGLWFGSLGGYGVYYSSNQGASWTQMQNPSPFIAYGGLTSLNNVLFGGSYSSSVWRRSGPLSEISGTVYLDLNNNGIMEPDEQRLQNLVVSTHPQPFAGSSNIDGNYSFYSDATGDTLMVSLPSPSFSSNPPFYITGSENTNKNFGIYVPPGTADLSVDLTNNNVFRPGFETQMILTIQNNGLSTSPAQVKLVLDADLSFVNAVPSYNQQSGDTLIWNLPVPEFLQSESISVTVMNNVFAILGDTVNCRAIIFPLTDNNPDNNYSNLISQFVGSYDPNDKTCLQGNRFDVNELQAGKELEYIIRFQNTGTYEAENVHISDTLSQFLQLNSFNVISYSHPMHYAVSGSGVVDFYFDNIQLPDSGTNQLLSNGYVKYSIKGKPTLIPGNAILNTAYIYFDFNAPIVTNTTSTLIAYPVVVTSTEEANSLPGQILVYPNPAADLLYIDTRNAGDGSFELMIMDLTGKQLTDVRLQGHDIPLSVSGLSQGIYIGILVKEGKRVGYFKFSKL